MTSEANLDQIVGMIYDAVEDVRKLAPAMQLIGDEINALAGHFLVMDDAGRFVYSQTAQAEFESIGLEYANYFHQVDPRMPWYSGGPVGDWRFDQDYLSDQAISGSEFYTDFIHKHGSGHALNGCMLRAPGHQEMVGFLRARHDGKFDAANRTLLQRVSPHLTRAAALRYRLQQTHLQNAVQGVELSQLPFGLVWIGVNSKIVTLNARAMALLDEDDALRVHNQCLTAWLDADTALLNRGLEAALRGQKREGCWLGLRRRQQWMPLLVSIIPVTLPPLPGLALSDGPFALLILQDADSRVSSGHLPHLKLAFDLTPAELRLAEALVADESLDAYAERAGITHNTVRTHLTHLFAKTGTTRQSQLMRLLMLSRPLTGSAGNISPKRMRRSG